MIELTRYGKITRNYASSLHAEVSNLRRHMTRRLCKHSGIFEESKEKISYHAQGENHPIRQIQHLQNPDWNDI